MRYSPPAIVTGRSITRSPSSITGTLAGSNAGLPMSTVTRPTVPKRVYKCSRCTRPPASIVRSSRGTMPLSYRYLATQRMALPPMPPALPSRLKTRIFASATSLCSMSTMP